MFLPEKCRICNKLTSNLRLSIFTMSTVCLSTCVSNAHFDCIYVTCKNQVKSYLIQAGPNLSKMADSKKVENDVDYDEVLSNLHRKYARNVKNAT